MNKPVPKSFERLREVLSEMTGNDASEIHLDSHLEEDLGFNLDEDFSRLLRKIDDEFSVSLDYEDSLNELTDAGETVIELAKLIDNELELGWCCRLLTTQSCSTLPYLIVVLLTNQILVPPRTSQMSAWSFWVTQS